MRVDEVIFCQQSVLVSAVHGNCNEVPLMLEEVYQYLFENVP